ncbi:MAG: 30S ribosomal protein S20, partial [Microgenomates group bacterium GW2011_GWC1_41_8]
VSGHEALKILCNKFEFSVTGNMDIDEIYLKGIKKALKALRLNKDGSKIEGLLRKVQSVAAKAAKKRVIHKNKAARLKKQVARHAQS